MQKKIWNKKPFTQKSWFSAEYFDALYHRQFSRALLTEISIYTVWRHKKPTRSG
jgi:hypothetical protein